VKKDAVVCADDMCTDFRIWPEGEVLCAARDGGRPSGPRE
jgi:hypothetical protein